MAENSKIEWTTHTANLWWGCVKVSPLCDHCYADDLDRRYGPSHFGLDARRRFIKSVWNDVPKWNAASDPVNPARVFWMSMGDLFEQLPPDHPDRSEMEDVRNRGFDLMEQTPNLHHLLLTKRISNVAKMVPERWLKRWPAHVRVGVSVGTQQDADRDIPRLMKLPCPNFLSMEPLLECVSLKAWMQSPGDWRCPKCPFILHKRVLRASDGAVGADVGQEREVCPNDGATMRPLSWLDWVITGGESGPLARPSHPDWFRLLRDECEESGVPFHFKQWGQWGPTDELHCIKVAGDTILGMKRYANKHDAGRVLDGRTWDELPGMEAV